MVYLCGRLFQYEVKWSSKWWISDIKCNDVYRQSETFAIGADCYYFPSWQKVQNKILTFNPEIIQWSTKCARLPRDHYDIWGEYYIGRKKYWIFWNNLCWSKESANGAIGDFNLSPVSGRLIEFVANFAAIIIDCKSLNAVFAMLRVSDCDDGCEDCASV